MERNTDDNSFSIDSDAEGDHGYDPSLNELNDRSSRDLELFNIPQRVFEDVPEEDVPLDTNFIDPHHTIPQHPNDIWMPRGDADTEVTVAPPRQQVHDSATFSTNVAGDGRTETLDEDQENVLQRAGVEYEPELVNLPRPFRSANHVAYQRFIPPLHRPVPNVVHGTSHSRIFHVEVGGRRVRVNVLGPRRPVQPAFRRPTATPIGLGRAALRHGLERWNMGRGQLPIRLLRRPVMQRQRRVVNVRPLPLGYDRIRLQQFQIRRTQGSTNRSYGRPGRSATGLQRRHYH